MLNQVDAIKNKIVDFFAARERLLSKKNYTVEREKSTIEIIQQRREQMIAAYARRHARN